MSEQEAVLYAALRNDPRAFLERTFQEVAGGTVFNDAWYIGALAYVLSQLGRGLRKRIIINIPPRCMKSITFSVAAPAFLMGCNPAIQVACASYAQLLATNFSNQTRQVMQSDWYKKAFPKTVLAGSQTEQRFETSAGGYRLATSVGGSFLGYGANVLIIDDANKLEDSPEVRAKTNEWFSTTAMSRLNNATVDDVVVVMHRGAEDDLAGYLLAQTGWDRLIIPAEASEDLVYQTGPGENDRHVFKAGDVLDPVRLPKSELLAKAASMSARAYSSLYLQLPVASGGNLIKWPWFKTYDPAQFRLRGYSYVLQTWDVASSTKESADYSVCTTWGVTPDGRNHLIHVYRDRRELVDTLEAAKKLMATFQPNIVLIEQTGVGAGLLSPLRRHDPDRVFGVDAVGDKVERVEMLTPYIQGGEFYMPASAPWLEGLRREISAFPGGRYDDQVDAVALFVKYAEVMLERAGFLRAIYRDGAEPPAPRMERFCGRYTVEGIYNDAVSRMRGSEW